MNKKVHQNKVEVNKVVKADKWVKSKDEDKQPIHFLITKAQETRTKKMKSRFIKKCHKFS